MSVSGAESSSGWLGNAVDGMVEDDNGADGPADFRIETDRLVLRRWREADYAAFAEMCSDPVVMRYLPQGPLDPAIAVARAAMLDGDFELRRLGGHPYGLAAVERREDGAFAGFTGVHHHRWFPNDLEIGWRFARWAWGNGYAIEAARAIAKYAFDELQVPRLISITMPENVRSIRVMERLGMNLDHRDVHEDIPIVVYAVTMEEYRSSAREL